MLRKSSKFVDAAVLGIMAASAASLLFTTPVKAADTKAAAKDATGMCHGVNACKGKGECGGKGHSCAGKNECKGKGWLKMTEADCKAKGGTFEGMKK